ncbi:MAG: hypothetical protein ACHREM_09150 [Polyangiales bacterium]
MTTDTFQIPCTRCALGSDTPMEPRLPRYGWRPGLVFNDAHHAWFAAGAEGPRPPDPVYVECPMCKGTAITTCDAETFIRGTLKPEASDSVIAAASERGLALDYVAQVMQVAAKLDMLSPEFVRLPQRPEGSSP